ncbi:Putative tatC-like protein ycf43 [Durusdinium trenchii]|uniref:TatC-like protein ycf43 n=1 Tax=Durusdinium trenchii TaxID=1381693 RepID=A0ABP0LDG2_9DINO
MVKFVCPEGKRRQGQLCFQAPKGAADGEETERMCGTEPDRTSSGDPAKSAKLQADGTSGASAELKALISSFRPSLTPKEVLHLGAFGAPTELPKSWLKGLDIRWLVTGKITMSPGCDVACGSDGTNEDDATVNHYGVKCGNTLEETEHARYGWFQWYCRFFQGRRSEDDPRQIKRWLKICGPTGRWKGNLIAKCVKANRAYNDPKAGQDHVSPVVRQSLLHWAYELTAADLREKKKEILQGGLGLCRIARYGWCVA